MTRKPDRAVAGVILCGGRSSRMGQDKASLHLGERPFLFRVTQAAGAVVNPVVVVAAVGQRLPDLPVGVQVVRDESPDAGPLAAVLTGIRALKKSRVPCDAFWLSACDIPVVCGPVVERLKRLRTGETAIVIRQDGRRQPFGGIYPLSAETKLRQCVVQGQRRLQTLLDCCPVQDCPAEDLLDLDPALLCLRNVNTPDEYRELQRLVDDRRFSDGCSE